MAKNLNQFIQETTQNGGCTYSLFGGYSPESGFVVSILSDQTTCKVNEFSPYLLGKFIKEHADKLSQSYNYLGSWIENGKVYLDVCEVSKDKAAALKIAAQNNQIAIFDLSTKETIYL